MRRGSTARSTWRAPRGGLVLRALLRQRRRLVLAGVAIALGVGYLAGALGLLDRIGAGLDDLATASADDADLVIEGGVAYESSLEQVRRLVPSAMVGSAESVPGVESASHRLEDVALVLDREGEPVVTPGLSEQPRGMNWPEDPSISNLEFLEGGPPGADDEVVLDARSAESASVGVGDTVVVAGKGKVGDYRVAGIVDTDAAGPSEGSSLVVLTTAEARVLFDRPTDDNRVAVSLVADADPDAVRADLAAMVPGGVEVTDGSTAAAHAQESLTRSFALVRALVTGFGVLALAVGMLTVSNSLGLLHAQRRHLFASFRLVGASVGQLRRAAFAEAGLLALGSSLVGIPLGVVLAVAIERALGALGSAVPTAGPLLTVRAAVVAVGVGLFATLLAAWRPVSNACRVPPVEAVRDVEVGRSRRFSPVATAVARAAIFAVAAAAVCVVVGLEPGITAVVAAVTAGVVALLGVLPTLLSGAVAVVMRVVPFRPRPLRRVAARDAARNPRRTAATTAAVLVAVAVVSGLAVFLQSFTASVDEAVGELISADLVVDSETFTRGGLPADLVEQLGTVEGVQAVSGWELGRGSVGDIGVRLTGLDGASALEVVEPAWLGSAPRGVDTRSAWISESLAQRTALGPGDPLPVVFTSGGFEDLTITGVYRTGQALLGDVVTDRSVVERQVPATVDLAALVRTDGSQSTATRVEELAATYGVTAVVSPAVFVDQRAELLRGFERVVQWMLLFTLLQALVGVINTLMLSVGERRREFGLLRVAGATRRSVLRMVLFEGTALASVGTLIGLAVGIGAAAAAVWALAALGLGVFSVPVSTVIGVALAAVVIGVLAAWVPARVAASVAPLEAVLDSGVEMGVGHAVDLAHPEPARVPAPMVTSAGGSALRTAPATIPPPFDPDRLPPAIVAVPTLAAAPTAVPAAGARPARVASTSVDALLTVMVFDGRSLVGLDPGSEEAAALLALYGRGPVAAPASEPATRPLSAAPEPPAPLGPEPAMPVDPSRSAPRSSEDPGRRVGRRRKDRDGPRPPRRRSRRGATGPAEGWVVPHPTGDPAGPAASTPAPDPQVAARCAVVLDALRTALASGEEIGPLVCGRVRSWPAVVARTDRRLLVVVERPDRLALESLHPVATGVAVRPDVGGTVVVMLVDRGRLLELTDVEDAATAESLVRREALRR